MCVCVLLAAGVPAAAALRAALPFCAELGIEQTRTTAAAGQMSKMTTTSPTPYLLPGSRSNSARRDYHVGPQAPTPTTANTTFTSTTTRPPTSPSPPAPTTTMDANTLLPSTTPPSDIALIQQASAARAATRGRKLFICLSAAALLVSVAALGIVVGLVVPERAHVNELEAQLAEFEAHEAADIRAHDEQLARHAADISSTQRRVTDAEIDIRSNDDMIIQVGTQVARLIG